MMSRHTRSVLIVDDAPPVRLLLRTFLGKLGFEESQVALAENGEEGLAAFEAKVPDLVFMDIEMPRMGGEETATQMLTRKPELKVIIMTGVEEGDARVRQMRSWGAFAVLPKPLRLEKIKALIDLIEDEQSSVERIR